MHEPTYRQALSHAWAIVWHNKILWIFGLLSVLIGQLGLSNFVGKFLLLADNPSFSSLFLWWPEAWPRFQIITAEGVFFFAWLLFLTLGLAVFATLVSIFSQGALIASAAEWFKTKKTPNFVKAWRKGVKHFWRLLSVIILEQIALAALLLLVMAVMNLFSSRAGGVTSFLITILSVSLGGLLALAVSAVAIYTKGYIIEEERSLLVSLDHAWTLFKRHLLVSLELSILVLLLNLMLILAIALVAFIILIPTVLLSLVASITGYLNLLTVVVVLYWFLLFIFVIFAGAIFNAFTTSAWIYLFMKMHHEGITSRVMRWIERLFKIKTKN